MRLPSNLPTKFRSPQLESIVSTVLSIVQRRRLGKGYTLQEMEAALADHPVINAGAEVRIALTLAAMGDYSHSDENIQGEVRRWIANYDGVFQDDVAAMMGYLPFGFSYTEVKHKVTAAGGARFDGLRTLNQDRTNFMGRRGEIEFVEWRGATESGLVERIPYKLGIHLTNQSYLTLDRHPKAIAVMDRVMPYYEASLLLTAALVVAGQRQATPILVGKTDTSAQTHLLDSSGNPILNPTTGQPTLIYQGAQMRDMLTELENGSIAVIDRLDDVLAVTQQASADLLMSALDWLASMMLLSFLVPRTIVMQGNDGVGDAGLAEFHLKTMLKVMVRDVAKIADALIEKCVKPPLAWNYGEMEDYGSFPLQVEQTLDSARIIESIVASITAGVIPVSDADAIDRIRELAGI